MRSSSLLPSLSGTASTHFRPIVKVSACTSREAVLFSGVRKSDNSGKKLKIRFHRRLRYQPAINRDPECERHDALCGRLDVVQRIGASKVFSTGQPLISSEPWKYRSNTSLPPRATKTACTLALEAMASRSAILHSAS